MRVKISFLKTHGSNGLIPLHHQRIISSFIEEVKGEMSASTDAYNFSSLKGTSKVLNGQIRFLSSKVSLVVSAPEKDFIEALLKKIFDRKLVNFQKLSLAPKSYQVISEPQFQTVMKYVCISPIVPDRPFLEEGNSPAPLDPSSHEFSDLIYDIIISRMEHSGYSEAQLNEFAEFELTPDPDYIQRIQNNQKKYARIYKNNNNETIYGYLFPFSMHAHPEVHRFVWERGIGLHTTEGYGMLDVVPEAIASEPLVP